MNHPSPVALVTGASSGIGHAAAASLVAAGYRVAGTSRRPNEVSALDGVEFFELDVADDASVASLIDAVTARFGRIDVLVNNAGIGIMGAAEETTIEQAQRLFNINLFGVMRLTNAVLPLLRSQGGGRIVNVSSVLGFVPGPYMALYTASKHALEGYTESLDHEIREQNIRAVLVQPSYTKTGFEGSALPAELHLDTYAQQRAVAAESLSVAASHGDDASVVGDAVREAATDGAPRMRYRAGKTAKQVGTLRRFVPDRAFDRQIRKLNRLAG